MKILPLKKNGKPVLVGVPPKDDAADIEVTAQLSELAEEYEMAVPGDGWANHGRRIRKAPTLEELDRQVPTEGEDEE